MNISPVNQRIVSQNFQAQKTKFKSVEAREKEQDKNLSNKKYSRKDMQRLAATTVLAGAVLGGGVIYLTKRPVLKNLRRNNETLSNLNKKLKEEAQHLKDSLSDIFEGDLAPKEIRDKIFNELKEKIEKCDYGYDIQTPPVTGKTLGKVIENAIPLPSSVGTANRINMKELDIPQIDIDGRFDFELPMSDEVKITHMKSADFKPVKSQPTNISESYADSVQWNNDKVARDLLQNFFDGHGQTLDGVKLHFEPSGNGRYKVRIEGKSTYTPDKAVYIGESTKRNDARAAGNYGEGLKMATLKLLKDGGADNVRIASDNWKVTYTLTEGNLSDKRVLAYSLDKTDKYNGNYMEFETFDRELLTSLRNTINRFYNSGNTHFKCPDFENELIGIKNLPKGEKGGIYIAGQRFEFDGKYDGLDDIVLFIKEKPPADVLDISRDRTSLNESNLEKIASWLAKDKRFSSNDRVNFLKSLENYWEAVFSLDKKPMDKFVEYFLLYINWTCGERKIINIKFPEKYVAYSAATPDVVHDLRSKGYKVCKSSFSDIGMPTIHDIIGDARAHEVVIPNDVEKKKILIIREAVNKLSPSLKGKYFSEEELNPKIYMFDRRSVKDRKLYSDCNAEAIVDKRVSKGFWIDKNYLNETNFSDALETALHELSHKAGGDESAEFSYMLTDVNKDAIGQLINDVKSRNEMQALNTLWESLS